MKTITSFFAKAIFPTLLLCCFCIALPPAFKSLSFGVLALVLLLGGEFRRFKYKAREVLRVKNPVLWIVGLYVLYCFGMLWSSNMEYGLDDLRVKLPLLVVPLLMGFVPREHLTKKKLWYYALSFSAGLVVVLVYCLVRAISNAVQPDGFHSNRLFYSNFTASFHATYLSLFCCTAMIVLWLCPLSRLFKLSGKSTKVIKVISILFLNICVLFINSRTAFIAIFVVYAAFLADLFHTRASRMQKLTVAIVIIANVFAIYNLKDLVNTMHSNTLVEIGLKKPINNSKKLPFPSIRVFMLTQTPELILRQPALGCGTGDLKDVLYNFCNEKQTNYGTYYNTHNQFLQTAITLGLVGLAVLVMILLSLTMRLWGKDRMVLLSGLVCFGMFFFTESILERQAGVHFCAFAFLWFNCFAKHKKIKD